MERGRQWVYSPLPIPASTLFWYSVCRFPFRRCSIPPSRRAACAPQLTINAFPTPQVEQKLGELRRNRFTGFLDAVDKNSEGCHTWVNAQSPKEESTKGIVGATENWSSEQKSIFAARLLGMNRTMGSTRQKIFAKNIPDGELS